MSLINTFRVVVGSLLLATLCGAPFAAAQSKPSDDERAAEPFVYVGTYTENQSKGLPAYYDGPNTAAEIQMHPSGKWLYTSNRGNETIVLFSIDAEKGTLTWVEEQNTGGRKPRHFGMEPSAKHLVICNQETDTVLIARIDSGNGRLKPSGVFTKVSSPACGIFVPVAGAGASKEEE